MDRRVLLAGTIVATLLLAFPGVALAAAPNHHAPGPTSPSLPAHSTTFSANSHPSHGGVSPDFGTGGWVCTITVSDPYVSMNAGSTAITGYGDQSCTPGPLAVEIDLYVQHQDWWGGWTTDAGPIYAGANGNSYLFQNIAYICPSGSVQTYRIVNQGWAQDVDGTWYTASVQSGNYLTVRC